MYESSPDQQPDAGFEPGELSHLVVGSSGRLLDARRTPVVVTGVTPELGAFEVEIQAFEDAGARWQLPLDDIGRFQFARGASLAGPEIVVELEASRARFARTETIDCDPVSREATRGRLANERLRVGEWFSQRNLRPPDVVSLVARREGDRELFALLEGFLGERDLAEVDRAFSETFISNPRSGELIKGHAIVLAELGLCPFHGKIVRDPHLFDEPHSKTRRAEHIIARLAFTQELWSRLGQEAVTLYRGAAVDGPLPLRSHTSFVSATFSSEVARAHFDGGPTTQTAAMWRQRVPVGRLLMTFMETRAMNDRFREAEAVLVADPDNHAF
jgi:hypothetical protein